MTLEISSDRRNEIKNLVYSAFLHGGSSSLPVKIGNIIRSYSNIKLITYSSQIKKYNITYQELIISAETKDSYVVYNNFCDKYCIYYNDIDRNIVTSNRVRWNLAHELGHVLLKHHRLCNKEKLLRSDIFLNNIDKESYNVAEDEANYFAQLILVPHAALAGFKINSSQNIRYMCKISDPAARRRYVDFIEWKSHINAKDEYDNRIFKFYYNFVFKRRCKKCEAGLIQRYGKYCSVCGSKNTLQWGDGEMKYPLLPTHENGKLKECTRCKNEETAGNGEFCKICGLLIANRCSNYDCSNNEVLPSNARYCPICGETSTFYNSKILNGWDYKPQVRNSYEMINIPDGIDEELPFN